MEVFTSKSAFPYGDFASEFAGAYVAGFFAHSVPPFKIGRFSLRPAIAGFITTLVSGFIFVSILTVVVGIPISVYLYGILPMVALVGVGNAIITPFLYFPALKLFKSMQYMTESDVEDSNHSHLNLQHLKKMLELENGTESRVQVVIYDKNSHIQDFQPTYNQGLLLFFEVCGGKLRGIGPFVEVSADGTKMSHFQEEKNVERKVEKEDSYWNRSIEEVVLDTVLSAITDYFSDYITVSSPFMYRRAILNEDTVCLCEAFSRQ